MAGTLIDCPVRRLCVAGTVAVNRQNRVVNSPANVTVLGSCGAWPEPDRACSGFLLEYYGFRVVLDLGYGTLPRLLAALGSTTADGLDAVVVTHAHPDHMIDVHGLFRARWFGRQGAPRIPLFAPRPVLDRAMALEDDDGSAVARVFDWHPLPAPDCDVGPFVLHSVELPHFVPNAGVRLSAPGLTMAYTGDTGPDPAIAELGRDADLFIVEATDRAQQPGAAPAPEGRAMLMTAGQAGAAASEAGARRLLLTHFWPGNDRSLSRADAEATYDGEVLIATEWLRIDLP